MRGTLNVNLQGSWVAEVPEKREENRKVANALWRLTASLLANLMLTNSTYTHLPPLSFLPMIDPSADVVVRALESCWKLWNA